MEKIINKTLGMIFLEHIIWAATTWLLLLIFVPIERIKKIWVVGLVSLIWFFIINYVFIQLGYYRFSHITMSIGGIPLIHLIGSAAGGMLLLNWMTREAIYKPLITAFFSGLLTLSDYLHVIYGGIIHSDKFTILFDYVLNFAGLSALVWICIALVGEEVIYQGNRTRFLK